jgi:hypothetical protein
LEDRGSTRPRASAYAGQHKRKRNANVGIHALSGIRTRKFDRLKKVRPLYRAGTAIDIKLVKY